MCSTIKSFSALHSVKVGAYIRILAIVRGWELLGSGLSSLGQGVLPQREWELLFKYFDSSSYLIMINFKLNEILQSDHMPKSIAETSFLCLQQSRTSISWDKAFTFQYSFIKIISFKYYKGLAIQSQCI